MMDDFWKRVVADLTLLTGLGVVAMFLVRKWVSSIIESHFQPRIKEAEAKVDIEAEKARYYIENTKTIYPEVVELVYRIRNNFRAHMDGLRDGYNNGRKTDTSFQADTVEFREGLYLLTEHLYKYRVFLDDNTFELLHRFKRLLQDVQIVLNRIERTIESEPRDPLDEYERTLYSVQIELYEQSIAYFDRTYKEVDVLYSKIIPAIQHKIESRILSH